MFEIGFSSLNSLLRINSTSPFHKLVEYDHDYAENHNTSQDGEDKPPDAGPLGIIVCTVQFQPLSKQMIWIITQVNISEQSDIPVLRG